LYGSYCFILHRRLVFCTSYTSQQTRSHDCPRCTGKLLKLILCCNNKNSKNNYSNNI